MVLIDAVVMDIPVNNKYVELHPEETKIAAQFVVPEGEEEQFAIRCCQRQYRTVG